MDYFIRTSGPWSFSCFSLNLTIRLQENYCYKNPNILQVSYLRGVLEMYDYIPDRRSDILEIVMEKAIQLDAGISRYIKYSV